jgi:hypothetical protein
MVQEFKCWQMCVSGRNGNYEFVLGAGVKVEERSDETPLQRAQKP